MTYSAERLKETIHDLKLNGDRARVREVLGHLTKELPKSLESLELFELGFELVAAEKDPARRCELLFEFVRGLPLLGSFLPVYLKAVDEAIAAADAITDDHHRTAELIKITKELPPTEDFEAPRLHAWRLALGLPDKPRFQKPDLKVIAKRLPKTLDYSFYRGYTLLGVVGKMPKKGPFLEVYREAISLAIDASAFIEEPYYRKYALTFIAGELADRKELFDLFIRCLEESYKSALEIKDPFAREHALVDIVKDTPKVPELYEFLLEVMEKALVFFTLRSWMKDVDALDVVDYVISAEELGVKESKKRRFEREKYAKRLSRVFEEEGACLKDIRFIEALKPFAHVWVQPRELRDSIRNAVARLQALKSTYHGKEMERPVFLQETRAAVQLPSGTDKESMKLAEESISIDLGATNTVVMRKKKGALPEFVVMDSISRKYDNVYVIPTVLGRESNTIGAEVVEENPVVNIKQMLMDGDEKARESMERFLKALYRHIKEADSSGGWFNILSRKRPDAVHITVPIGFTDYNDALKNIARKVFKVINVKFIEEPLAAAVGYEIAEEKDQVVMIVDFGGCTLDCMVLRLNLDEVHVIAKPERAQVLGGHDIDRWLAGHLASKAGMVAENLPYRFIAKAEETKIALTNHEEAEFEWDGKGVSISRYEFEEILDSHEFYRFVDRTISYVMGKAEKVGLKKDAVGAVILTGGSSQIPSFKDKIGHLFPDLRERNRIFDHSPLSAVGEGAALYGTREVVDRHLGMPYALRHVTDSKDSPFTYTIILEKGTSLPFERTFRVRPARKHGLQKEIFVELFEVPESLVARRWVEEAGVEFLKQEINDVKNVSLTGLKTVALPFGAPIKEDVELTFAVDEKGALSIRWGVEQKTLSTGIRLQ